MTIEDAIQSQPFDAIPVVSLPDEYALGLPDFHARMAAQYGPVFRRPLGPDGGDFGEWIVYLVGPEANRFVMASHRHAFSHDLGWTPQLGPLFEKGLLNTDDPAHAHDRRMMNPAFAIGYMNRYLPIMQRVIADRTATWLERGTVDLYEEMRKIAFDVAAEALVGLRRGEEVDRLRDLFYRLLHADDGAAEGSYEDWVAAIMQVRAELDAMLLRHIAHCRQHPTDDILGLLVQARDENGEPFSDRQLLGQVHILLVAGHETTTTMAAWVLYQLALHPDWRERVEAELAEVLRATDEQVTVQALRQTRVLGYVMNEVGRLFPPVAFVPRVAVEDVEFGGYHIPARTYILLSLSGGHRLGAVFERPERFDPDRFAPPREEDRRSPYALVPFGGGPRICIGINFAQVEIKALVAQVLERFRLEPMEGADVVHAYYGITASLPNGVPVRVSAR